MKCTAETFIFSVAKLDDAKDLFDWRNHANARRNSLNSDLISWSDHLKWFSSRMNDPSATIFIIYSGKTKVGSIRFEEKENMYRVSIVLAPEHTSKGISADIIRAGTELFLKGKKVKKPVIAEVKENNIASIKAFKRAGFKESHIIFEYKAENATK